MKKLNNFFIDTIKAGIFFILPVVICLFIILKIIKILTPLSQFVESRIAFHKLISFSSTIVSISIILIIFFVGGIIETKVKGSAKLIAWMEDNILILLPGYQLMKSTAKQSIGLELSDSLKVVLVPTDGWSLGFLVEELANNEVLVYIPDSPNPNEGNLNIFQKSEIKTSTLTTKDAYVILKSTGIGTREYFDKGNFSPRTDAS